MSTLTDSIRVLHVDDDPDFAEIATDFLEREDERFDIQTATNASEGLDRLAQRDFDCVVSDYDMPGQNGLELLKAVRDKYPDLPFILYTGKGSESIASEAISAGVTDYLQKESGTSQYTVLANRIMNSVEKYHAQIELADRETRLNLFFEESPLGAIEWNEDFEFVRVNAKAEELLGYTEEELLGRSWELIVPESDSAAVKEIVDELLADEGGYYSRNENVRKNGDRIVCEWHNRAIIDDSGETVTIFSKFQDVTQRAERKRELERYEAYLEESTDIVTVLDEDGTIEYQSPSVSRILGYDEDELIGENGFDFIHPEDKDESFAAFMNLVAEPESTETVELRFLTAAGEWRWLEVRGTNRLEQDPINGVVTNNRDITDRKEREQELTAVMSRLEALFENSPDMINVHDADGNIIDPNPRLCEKTGYDASELTAMKVWELDRSITPEEANALWEDMEVGDQLRLEGEYQCRDGSTFPVEVHVRRLNLDAEDRFVAISRDIADQKTYERELERQNDRLNEFASVVSHDLRNPLATAEGRLELARSECDSEHLEDVAMAHDRMAQLIEDLLALAREGETVREMNPVDLRSFIETCWQNVVTNGASLSIDTDRHIQADQSRLRQLLENLIRNAIEHGGEDVRVRVGELEDGFYLEDDGPGIPENQQDDVFNAGYSTSDEGTGFGLSIVKQVADAHGWDVHVTDGADGGARFEITGVESDGE